jgi:hypothetical protein
MERIDRHHQGGEPEYYFHRSRYVRPGLPLMSIAEIYGHYDLTTLKARRWFSCRKPKAPEAQGGAHTQKRCAEYIDRLIVYRDLM